MSRQKNNNSRLVYSSDGGKICDSCGYPKDKCCCSTTQKTPVGDGRVRVSRSTKGRKGKGVTLITGLPLTADDLKQLAKKLKQKCGTGGTVKDGVIEIQGDHRDTLVDELKSQGYDAKKSGG